LAPPYTSRLRTARSQNSLGGPGLFSNDQACELSINVVGGTPDAVQSESLA
jgi:hypothetical protein